MCIQSTFSRVCGVNPRIHQRAPLEERQEDANESPQVRRLLLVLSKQLSGTGFLDIHRDPLEEEIDQIGSLYEILDILLHYPLVVDNSGVVSR